eukprot:10280664-Karenia_brevis.AAC.1
MAAFDFVDVQFMGEQFASGRRAEVVLVELNFVEEHFVVGGTVVLVGHGPRRSWPRGSVENHRGRPQPPASLVCGPDE